MMIDWGAVILLLAAIAALIYVVVT